MILYNSIWNYTYGILSIEDDEPELGKLFENLESQTPFLQKSLQTTAHPSFSHSIPLSFQKELSQKFSI